MRKYLCTDADCMAEVYLVRGRRFMVEPSEVAGANHLDSAPKPVRPKKTQPPSQSLLLRGVG